jgi:hypothetical protein
MANSGVAEAPALNPVVSGAVMKSNNASTAVAPTGTSVEMAYMSTGSRRQVSGLPAALSCKSTRSAIGPVGPCSPGIHFG